MDNGVAKLAFIDTEPFSAIIAKGIEGYRNTLLNNVLAGYSSAYQNFGQHIPVFNEVFEQRMEALTEKFQQYVEE